MHDSFLRRRLIMYVHVSVYSSPSALGSIVQPVPSVLHKWQVLRLPRREGLDVQLLEVEGWVRTSQGAPFKF